VRYELRTPKHSHDAEGGRRMQYNPPEAKPPLARLPEFESPLEHHVRADFALLKNSRFVRAAVFSSELHRSSSPTQSRFAGL